MVHKYHPNGVQNHMHNFNKPNQPHCVVWTIYIYNKKSIKNVDKNLHNVWGKNT